MNKEEKKPLTKEDLNKIIEEYKRQQEDFLIWLEQTLNDNAENKQA